MCIEYQLIAIYENREIVLLKAILHSGKALQLFGLGLNLSCQGGQSLTYWCYLLQVILPGIRCVRLRNELETFQKRLKLFEKRAAEDGLCRIKRHIKIRKGTPVFCVNFVNIDKKLHPSFLSPAARKEAKEKSEGSITLLWYLRLV
jgi:hypothetical protein